MSVLESVVLVVYEWSSVQPGTLSWVFPSLGSAVRAAHAMTNAVNWAVIAGSAARASVDAAFDLTKLRAAGGILIEQTRG
jgi:hypothetical protein